jgi:hypothetical protein
MKILRKFRWVFAVGVLSVTVLSLIAGIGTASATDWPCFNGPNRDGTTTEGIERWPPKELWRATIGQGYSETVVSQGRVYTMGWSNNHDYVYCFNESSTGTNPPVVWQASYSYNGSKDGVPVYHGTRCTPTVDSVDSNEVYTYSADGQLKCFNAITGSNMWSRAVTNGVPPLWGYASSPLVVGNNVIVNAGSACIAINKSTSLTNWSCTNSASSSQPFSYSAPFAVTIGTQQTVIVAAHDTVFGINPANGNVLWSFDNPNGLVSPVVYNNQIWASQANGYGAKGFAVMNLGSGQLTNTAWANTTSIGGMNSSVIKDGFIYGLLNPSGVNTGPSGLSCIEFSTGIKKWCSTNSATTKFGLLSGIMLANDEVVVMTGTDNSQYDESGTTIGNGNLIVASATSSGYTELHRTNLMSGALFTWTSPTLANGKLYLRSQSGLLICYDVSYNASSFSNNIPPADWVDHYYSGTNNYTNAAASDSDHDGMTAWQEYVAGTDPTNNSSCLKASISMSNNNIVVAYPTIAATDAAYAGRSRYYGLESSTNLQPPTWVPVPGGTNVLGNNNSAIYTNNAPSGALFYRVRVMLQ